MLVFSVVLTSCVEESNTGNENLLSDSGDSSPDLDSQTKLLSSDTHKTQKVRVASNNDSPEVGEDISLRYTYESSGEKLPGLSIRLHWSSEFFDLSSASNFYMNGFLGRSRVETDNENFDGDVNTDKYVVVAWADLPYGKWPENHNSDTDLFSVALNAKRSGRSAVNLSSSGPIQGYVFEGHSKLIQVQ